MARPDRRVVAQRTERLALQFLTANGLKLIERNFRCRYGEIDLVMEQGAAIVFVEVRFRKRSRFATAAHSVDARKQRKICRTASYFLQRYRRFQYSPVRFDVVAFDGPAHDDFTIQWLPDAFRPTGRGI